jgi:hypothetical protein
MTETPKIDYNAIAVKDAEPIKSARAGRLAGTPFVMWLTTSRDENKAKEIGPLPASAEKDTIYLIRRAAEAIETGVRVSSRKDDAGNVFVTFQSKPKRATLTPEQRKERDEETARKRAAREAKREAKKADAIKVHAQKEAVHSAAPGKPAAPAKATAPAKAPARAAQ